MLFVRRPCSRLAVYAEVGVSDVAGPRDLAYALIVPLVTPCNVLNVSPAVQAPLIASATLLEARPSLDPSVHVVLELPPDKQPALRAAPILLVARMVAEDRASVDCVLLHVWLVAAPIEPVARTVRADVESVRLVRLISPDIPALILFNSAARCLMTVPALLNLAVSPLVPDVVEVVADRVASVVLPVLPMLPLVLLCIRLTLLMVVPVPDTVLLVPRETLAALTSGTSPLRRLISMSFRLLVRRLVSTLALLFTG